MGRDFAPGGCDAFRGSVETEATDRDGALAAPDFADAATATLLRSRRRSVSRLVAGAECEAPGPGQSKRRAGGNRRCVCRETSTTKLRRGSDATLRDCEINQRTGAVDGNRRIERIDL